MRAASTPRYGWDMYNPASASVLAASAAPLLESFGDKLTLWRDGNVAHWCYEGQTVVVAAEADSEVCASFVDAPALDVVRGTPIAAIYRSSTDRRYRLNSAGCAAMVRDIMAFFSGEREPIFTFVGTDTIA